MASADKQAARNREILIAKAQGDDTNEIAERYDLSPTRVRQILASGTAVLADVGLEPTQVALERRAQYEVIFEEAMAMFERIPDSNPSPKVGALRLSLAALDRLSVWDQCLGVIPPDPSSIYGMFDNRRFLDALWEAAVAAGIPRDAMTTIVKDAADEVQPPPLRLGPPRS